ncbi:hypothetical protein [Spirosoma areae]
MPFLTACSVHPTPAGVDGGRVIHLNARTFDFYILAFVGLTAVIRDVRPVAGKLPFTLLCFYVPPNDRRG